MNKYAVISFESSITDKQLIKYEFLKGNEKEGLIFRDATTVIPFRGGAYTEYYDYVGKKRNKYRIYPYYKIFTFEAENDDAAKLIFEVE